MRRSVNARSGQDMRLRTLLLTGVSAAGLVYAPLATAQTALPAAPPPPTTTGAAGSGDTDAVTDIVVTGIRQSLQSSQNIKRFSPTVVDAITAEDIGALPDRSVTESLQRVPGVAISHFQQVNDPDHISPEGQDINIRGLPYVESQFNGRDAFTANKGRAVSFQDIPPELLAGVEVYKNQTADQIEGGIAGVVNLVTRRPLDTDKDIYALSADLNYGDLSGKTNPEASGLISKQWDTEYGRFGVLGSLSYSRIESRQDSTKVTSFAPRRDADPSRGITAIGTPIDGLVPGETYYIPVGGGITREDYDRERKGFSAAAQWESPDKSMLATFQFLRTDTQDTWTEHTFAVASDAGQGTVVPVLGTTLQFDNNNVLKRGTLTGTFPYKTNNGTLISNGIPISEISRGVNERATTDDFSAHLAWQATSRLKFDFDAQYADSTSDDLDVGVYPGTWGDQTIDLTGTFPKVTATPTAGANFTSFADPRSTFWRAAIDHEDRNFGREITLRADGDFEFDGDSPLKRIKFGERYAHRSQSIASDAYNWGNLSEAWNGSGPVFASNITPAGFGTYNFGDFLRGSSLSGQTIYGFQSNNALNYANFIKGARAIQGVTVANGGFINYNPLGQRPGVIPVSAGGDGYHTIGELSSNDEKTYATYARLDYGLDNVFNTGVVVDGNVGLRYVHTDTDSTGGVQFPLAANIIGTGITNGLPNCPIPGAESQAYNICSNTIADQRSLVAFADGSSLSSRVGQSYDDLLPSFNLRVSPQDDVQFRFAYSKAITRPSFNDLHNFVSFALYGPATTSVNNPYPGYRANAEGNPLLKPTKSDNLDLSAEWYFSRVGFVSLTGFYKRLTNVYAVSNGIVSYDSNGVPSNLNQSTPGSLVSFTNGSGVTQTARFFGTQNNNNVTEVKGVEFDYQQVLTFLPSPLDGIGLTGNFTYIQADPLAGQASNYAGVAGASKLPFPGISRYNANGAVFYEKYGVSARMAYTWRSNYLVVSQDVNYPNQPVYSGDVGEMDFSAFYNITDNVKVGVEGTNILNSTSRTYTQINSSGLRAIRGAFATDRRYTFGVRTIF